MFECLLMKIYYVIWFEAPESMIHKSMLDLEHLHEAIPKSIEEVLNIVPANLLDAPLLLESSPELSIWNCCNKLII